MSDFGERARGGGSVALPGGRWPGAALDGARLRALAASLLALGIFWVDSFTSFHSAIATLYVLVLLLAGAGLERRPLIGWALACAALTLTSFLVVHRAAPATEAALRLLVSLAANAVTTALLLHRAALDARMAREERRYATMTDTLAIAIWEHDFRPVAEAVAALRAQGVTDLAAHLRAHPALVAELRRQVRITDVNRTALDMMGVPSKAAFFRRLGDFLPETDASFADCILAIDERRPMFQAETQVLAADGSPIDIIVAFGLAPDTCLAHVPGSILDIRERKRLETTVERTRIELERVQRTAAIGAMSASIAHEINQPISAVQSYADSAARWLARPEPDLDEVRLSLAGLNLAVANIHAVIRRVRSLVGGAQGEMQPLALGTLVTDTLAIAARDLDAHGARIQVAPLGAPQVIGDPILLKHLLLNLITNALQAMEAAGVPDKRMELALETRADRVRLLLRDHGPGLDPAMARPFETFATTKPGGMGLGLAICRSIVELHDGRIAIANHPDGGALATIELPLAAA
ncbi:Adaptive-response sensory-kinase SasA [Sphingomonas sp. S2M10]|uniref:sensor histidine kinase n=1 Tax=Sphingomonas sp. S2M10 TaxID=2705010 RepID=UPI001456C000|nr:PAS domain-containing sensor histidine kinase [Sphingomonas sp. S2M10]NLS25980.1 Adaptive-response sensory-kinase SasA [Sphingomonas sp. S2M10]